MFDLTGKTALVTGATGGIGAGIARAFHSAGATVAISGRQVEKLEALKAELGDRIVVVPCDLADRAQVQKLIDEAIRRSAGVSISSSTTPPDERQPVHGDEGRAVGRRDRRQPDLHVHALPGRRPRHAAQQVGLRPHHQYLVCLGRVRQSGTGELRASKAGMIGMTKSLAREIANRGITANCIAPGFIKTAMTDVLNEKQQEEIAKMIPAQRFGSVEDIAAGALYLASNEGGYITGQTLHINGGMAMV